MKALFLAVSLAACFSSCLFANGSDYTFALTTTDIGPYIQGNAGNPFTVKIENLAMRKRDKVSLEVKLTMNGYSERRFYSSSTSDIRIMASMSYTVPDISAYVSKTGTKVYFGILENGSLSDAYSFTIYSKASSVIDASLYTVADYSPNPVGFRYEANSLVEFTEKLGFAGISAPFDGSDRYRLPFGTRSFTYQSVSYSFRIGKCYLELPEEGGFFDLIPDRRLPLSVSYSGGTATLTTSGPFFVEPSTLAMSLSPSDGFVSSQYFFLPRNHVKDLDGLDFVFRLLDVGGSENEFFLKAQFRLNLLPFGDCADSDFCVSGGIRS